MNSKQLYRQLCERLLPVSADPRLEAGELLKKFCGLRQSQWLWDTAEISGEQLSSLRQAAERRLEGYPLQYLLGEWDFYGRTFEVGEGVLIPRADTEILVETGLSFLKTRENPVIADLCSGSGCIAVTMAAECGGATVYAVEKSGDALYYLRRNAAAYGERVKICQDDVLESHGEYPDFDLILSNPPYLTRSDMDALQMEVRHEPKMALYGDEDGLLFYREMTRLWKKRIKSGGMLAYEIGLGQEPAVAKIFTNNCFSHVCFHRDLCGIIRVVSAINNRITE